MTKAVAKTNNGKFSNKKAKFNNIPTEIKKIAVNIFLKGIMFFNASKLYSDSEITNPARNAPKANFKPNCLVMNAVAKQMTMIEMRNNS